MHEPLRTVRRRRRSRAFAFDEVLTRRAFAISIRCPFLLNQPRLPLDQLLASPSSMSGKGKPLWVRLMLGVRRLKTRLQPQLCNMHVQKAVQRLQKIGSLPGAVPTHTAGFGLVVPAKFSKDMSKYLTALSQHIDMSLPRPGIWVRKYFDSHPSESTGTDQSL